MSDTDYLSRNAIVKNLTDGLKHYEGRVGILTYLILERFMEYIKEFPAADAQPIKHGKWINEEYDTHFNEYHAKCSVCDNESTDAVHITKFHIYCEHCGAIMDGDNS